MNISDELMWVEHANCKGLDTEEFFVKDGGTAYENESTIKRICAACEVKTECLNYALSNSVVGYWGGTSEKIRRIMRKEKNIIGKVVTSEGMGRYA